MADTESTESPNEATERTGPEPVDGEVPEPREATHGAEDETWSTDDHDTAHLEDRIAALETELAEVRQQMEQERERHLRARADYQNLQRRTEEERNEWPLRAAARILERLVEPVSVLGRASRDLEGVASEHAKGVRMAHDQLWNAMVQEGLEPVPGVGEAFDHTVHEAVAREASEHPEGTVIEVIRPGYRIKGKLLRPAMVKVSDGPAAD